MFIKLLLFLTRPMVLNVTVFNWTYSLNIFRFPRTHNKLLRSNALVTLHLISYVTKLSSSSQSFDKHRALSSPTTCYRENKGSKRAFFNIQNPGAVISFLLVFIQFITSFEYFVFMALSVRIKNHYIKKCPLPSTLPLISAAASTDTFPPIDYSSPVRGCNFGPFVTSFVTSCNNSPWNICFSLLWFFSFTIMSDFENLAL